MKTQRNGHDRRIVWILSLLLPIQMILFFPTGAWAFGADLPVTMGPYSRFLPGTNAHAVATDSKGNIFVVFGAFELNGGEDQEVLPMVRMYDAESDTWLPPSELSDPADRTACWWHVAVASDCNDNIHFAWVQMFEPNRLFYRVRYADGSWGPPEMVWSSTGLIERPSLAADPYGNVFVCWAEGLYNPLDSSYLFNIGVRARDVLSGWWSWGDFLTFYVVDVDHSPGATTPSIALEVLGDKWTLAHIAFNDAQEGHVGISQVSARVLPDSVIYLPFGTEYMETGGTGIPSIASQCDKIHLMWADSNDGTLQYRIYVDTDSTYVWLDPGTTGLPDGIPNIATDGLGNVHAVLWAGPVIYARFSQRDQAWTNYGPVDDPVVSYSENPSVAVHELGDIHVVWQDYRAGDATHVYYDRGECLILPAAPEGPGPAMASLELRAAIAAAGPADRLPVIVQMREQIDRETTRRRVAGLTPFERKDLVVAELRNLAERSQIALRRELAEAERVGEAERVRPLWLVNAVAARLSPERIRSLTTRPDIEAILLDLPKPMIQSSASARAKAEGPRNDPGSPRKGPPAVPNAIAWNVEWINAPAVWALGYDGDCITVGVVDTGVDLEHPDLAANIWTNSLEADGQPGVDDDENGYVDDIHGWNAITGDGAVQDDAGHGTHVSGTIAGDGTGGTITGVAPGAKIMALKVLNEYGGGTFADIVEGIQYAIVNGAQVLNLSLGADCAEPADRHLLRTAADGVELMGVTMCVAAGNSRCHKDEPNEIGTPGDIPPPWLSPDQPYLGMISGVTTVGATDYQADDIAPFSSHGPVDWSQTDWPHQDWWLCDPVAPHVGLIKPDIVAPGARVLSTQLGGGYVGEDPEPDDWSGTSMASPHIAGVAALILSKNHQLLSSEIHELIETTADDLGSFGKDNAYGAGMVDALDAVLATPVEDGAAVELIQRYYEELVGDGDGRLDAGETVEIVIELANNTPYLLHDAVGELSATANVIVTEATGVFGDIDPFDTRWNDDDPFRIRIPADAVDGVATFVVEVTAYGACATVYWSDSLHACPHIADHDTSGVRFSVTDQGIAGFLTGEQEDGSGFVFPKEGGANRLYIGSFWAGTDSTYVLNRDYDADPNKDWETLGCIELRTGQPGDPVLADEVAIGAYDDAGHASPRGLTVVQRSFASANPPDDDFVIVTYESAREGATPLHGVWQGLFMDWDLDATGGFGSNRGGVDPERDMVYMWREGGGDGSYVGIRSLSHTHALQMGLIRNSVYIWPNEYLTDPDRFHFLSGDLPEYRVTETPVADDWSAVIGIAPFTIAPGESLLVGFAVLAGSSLADLQANADAAALLWASGWGAPTDVVEPRRLPAAVALEPPQPNPFGRSTILRFDLPREMEVRLEIFDVAGRRVAGLLDGPLAAGRHSVVWRGTDPSDRVVASGLYYVRLSTREGHRMQKILVTR